MAGVGGLRIFFFLFKGSRYRFIYNHSTYWEHNKMSNGILKNTHCGGAEDGFYTSMSSSTPPWLLNYTSMSTHMGIFFLNIGFVWLVCSFI